MQGGRRQKGAIRQPGRAGRWAVAALAAVALAVPAAPATASGRLVERDRTDNQFYFEYRARTGRIPVATSSVVLDRADKVEFYAYVSERRGATTGGRLAGRLVLRLRGDRPVRYRGVFAFKVKTDGGEVAVERSRFDGFTLRPRAGGRRERLHFRFDLPSGSYRALGTFRKASSAERR